MGDVPRICTIILLQVRLEMVMVLVKLRGCQVLTGLLSFDLCVGRGKHYWAWRVQVGVNALMYGVVFCK